MTRSDEWFVWDPSPKAHLVLATAFGGVSTPDAPFHGRGGGLTKPHTWRGWTTRREAVKVRESVGSRYEAWLVVNRAEAEALAASYLARRALEGT